MNDHDESWEPIATYTAGFEADVALSLLEAEGIRAVKRSNNAVGIFGPGFEGRTGQGYTVLVPSGELARARELLLLDE